VHVIVTQVDRVSRGFMLEPEQVCVVSVVPENPGEMLHPGAERPPETSQANQTVPVWLQSSEQTAATGRTFRTCRETAREPDAAAGQCIEPRTPHIRITIAGELRAEVVRYENKFIRS